MAEQEAVVAEEVAPAVAPVAPVVEAPAPQPVASDHIGDATEMVLSDADLAKLKAKRGTAPRYMISWRLLDALIARMEQAEKRLADNE